MRSPIARRLPVAWIVAWRYIRGQRSQILTGTAWAALFATTLGVTSMVIAMALMTGYTEDLQRKLIGLQGEIIASPLSDDAKGEAGRESIDRAAAVAGVVRSGEVAYGEGSLSSQRVADGIGVVLRGIEPASTPQLLPGALDSTSLAIDQSGVAGVMIGSELQRQLEVEPGDTLRLVVLNLDGDRVRFRYRSARLVGAFTTGFAEFDSSWVLVDRQVLQQTRGTSGVDVMEFKLAAGTDAAVVASQIELALGPQWLVQRWEALNHQLFAALRLQERLLFLVLGLIVIVSTFNIASTLVILVRERLADLGVLSALGLAPSQLRRIFITYGMLLGLTGTAAGVAIGSAIAWTLTRFELVRFDPEVAAVYFIDSVPFRVEALDVAAIVVFSLVVTFFACSLPALRAARLKPAAAFRHQ